VARIDGRLLERLSKKLNVGDAALYGKIQKAANKYGLERPEAALALALDQNLNINKYSTPAQRSAVSAARTGRAPAVAVMSPVPMKATRLSTAKKVRPKGKIKGNHVFVVVGRNKKINKALFQFLRAIGLSPIEWERARSKTGKANPYIGEILEQGFKMAAAVVVLMTPDDDAKLKQEFLTDDDDAFERRLSGQARPNVLFEAGYAMGKYPDHTVLLQVGKLRPFSDISGRHVVRMTGAADSRHTLVGRLRSAGLDAKTDGTDWLSEGDFALN
jgi:predicted nucleotide-binding protein